MIAQKLYELFIELTSPKQHHLPWEDLAPHVRGAWEAVREAARKESYVDTIWPV